MEEIEYKGYTIRFMHDEDAPEPCEDDSLVKFVSHHPRYGKNHGFSTPQETQEFAKEDEWEIFPVHAYIHSGVVFSLKPFTDPWDSGMYGYLLLKKGEFTNPDKAAVSILAEYNYWTNGESYGYEILDPETEEHIESCWGFHGRDYVEQVAKEAIDFWMSKAMDHNGQKLFPFATA